VLRRIPPINLTTVTSRPLHAVLLPELPLPALAAALDGTGPALLPLDPGLPRARLGELLTAFAPAALMTTQGLQSFAPAGPGGPAAPGVADDVAVVLATSGSTGLPKGAELSAAALLASARASLARVSLDTLPHGGRWLCCLPTHHISGLGVLVRSLVTGADPVIAGRADGPALASAGCDYVSLVPTQLKRLLEAGAPLAQFTAILLGGAAIPASLLDAARAAGARVVTTYGMTETCGGCVYDGLPLDGVLVASGADGRIRIAGPVLFSRYRLAPELTAACTQDGWFITSDLGGPDADGLVVLRGRADDVINTGGEKVVPADVEQVLRECEGVREVVVVGVPDPEWGESVTAIVVADAGPVTPGLEQLRAAAGARLPRHAVPRRVVYVGDIPMLASGKPDRLRLRNIAAQAPAR
jgi:O-succinylbenzoic acid--CoA ligase